MAPVGIAVGRNGDLFVSQLFGGEISRIKHGSGKVSTYAKANLPAAVEWTPRGSTPRSTCCRTVGGEPGTRRAASWRRSTGERVRIGLRSAAGAAVN